MSKRPWVYIAGPITIGDTHRHVHVAMGTWRWLFDRGCTPICPHWSALQQMAFPMDLDRWLEYDLRLLSACDALLRLPGESKGADREVEFARDHGIPVFDRVDHMMDCLFGVKGWAP